MPIQKFTVSRDDTIYESWPDVVLTEGGKLICVFTECAHHLDRSKSRLCTVESTDRGRTWSEKRYLTGQGTKTHYFNCARISKAGGGLAIVCDFVSGEKGPEHDAVTYVWRADAEGTSWGEPAVYPFNGIVPDKLLELSNGRLLISNHRRSEVTGKLEQHLHYSDDGGAVWSDEITVAADPSLNLCEASIIECGGGMLVAFLRENSILGYDVKKVISHDFGSTWGPVCGTPLDSGHRPTAGFLRDGRVMITYRYIPRGTQNFFAAFLRADQLEKENRRDQAVRIMPLDYDRNPSPDLGYSGWAQFPDGEIYVVNYIKDDADLAYIRGYSFRPEDVVLPETSSTTKRVFRE